MGVFLWIYCSNDDSKNLGNDKSPNSSLINSNEKKEKKNQYLIIKKKFNCSSNCGGVFFFHYHLATWIFEVFFFF